LIFHIPPDLVVKAQDFDIIELIPSLIRGKTSSEHHVGPGNRTFQLGRRKARYLAARFLTPPV
jgi:hypothetical protein